MTEAGAAANDASEVEARLAALRRVGAPLKVVPDRGLQVGWARLPASVMRVCEGSGWVGEGSGHVPPGGFILGPLQLCCVCRKGSAVVDR